MNRWGERSQKEIEEIVKDDPILNHIVSLSHQEDITWEQALMEIVYLQHLRIQTMEAAGRLIYLDRQTKV